MQTAINDTELKRILHHNGLRTTKVRLLVYHVLQNSQKPLTIQQIVGQCHGVHFVSVYRCIDVFLAASIINVVPIGLKNMYELSDSFKPHHHHVTCEACGHSVAVGQESIENLMHKITLSAGMRPTHHHFEAFGICNKCSTG